MFLIAHFIKQKIGFAKLLKVLIFSYLCMVEKVLFIGLIFEIEILMDLHVLRSPGSEHNGLKVGVCVYASVISI